MDWKVCFKGKRILVAEDDEVNRELMQDIFSSMNCEVEFGVDGNEVVKKYQEAPYDLILMDIRMPNKDGIQATLEIRALEKGGKRIPILALSASVLEEEREGCVTAGADDFVMKPIHLNELRDKMAKYLLGGLK